MSIIQGHAKSSGVTGFYSFPLEQSLRFNDDDSAYLSWTPNSAGDQKTWTISFWMKRSGLGGGGRVFDSGTNSENWTSITFNGNDTLQAEHRVSDTTQFKVVTSAVLRDTSAWYHIVVHFDIPQPTPSNRLKLYINGEEASYSSTTYGSSNTDTYVNSTNTHYLGAFNTVSQFFDGYLAEVNFLNGIAATADDFGELKNGVWIPKEYTGAYDSAAQVTAGNLNGFRLSFADDAEVEAFNTVLYEGNGATTTSTQSVTGVGFSPDLVWIKNRDNTTSNSLYDTVRGADVTLRTNTTDKDFDYGNTLLSFDSDGFTVGNYSHVNGNGLSHVAWGWKAGGAPTVDNSAGAGNVPTAGSVKIDGVNSTSELAGSLPAIRLSASTTYGFSIVTWQANNQTVGTVAHGLGVAPDFLIIKNRDSSTNAQWVIGHSAFGFNGQGYLNLTAGFGTNSGSFNNTAPTSTVFTVGTDQTVNLGTNKYIGYCWAETSGYSKIDGYSGSASEITVYTTDDGTASGANPFKPAFVFIKRSDSDTDAYSLLFDNTRDVEGDNGRHLFANLTNTESDSSSRKITFNDNGFTIPADASADASVNAGSESTYIYAAFADTREAAFWLDQSGNDNDWQPVNLDHNDTLADSPTDNFATLNPLSAKNSPVLSEGNLKTTGQGTGSYRINTGTIGVSSGKWYFEGTFNGSLSGENASVGITTQSFAGDINNSYVGQGSTEWGILLDSPNDILKSHSALSSYSDTWADGDIFKVAFDVDGQKIWFGKNETWYASGDPSSGTNAAFTNLTAESTFYPVVSMLNDDSFTLNFGQSGFTYTPPTGYLALSTANLPDPVIDPAQGSSPEDYFGIDTYTGNGGTIDSDFGFDCDLVWYKNRSRANTWHYLFDKVRGDDLPLYSNDTFAEDSQFPTYHTQSFITGGSRIVRTLGDHLNFSGDSYVAWAWKAGTSVSGSTGGSGTPKSYTGSVSTKSGFSIIAYEGNGTAGHTIPHHLDQAPDMLIIKNRDDDADHWRVYHSARGANFGLKLSDSSAEQDIAGFWNDTDPTSSVFTVGDHATVNTNTEDYIAYCFHSVEGFSKFGSYTGNGSTDGTFVYTGFRPAFVMIKGTGSNRAWVMVDTEREPYNVAATKKLYANHSGAENNSDPAGDAANLNNYDILSNGIKLRDSSTFTNGSTETYIFMAFSDANGPFKYSNAR